MSASEGKLATGTYMLRKLASAPLINSHSLGINLLTGRAAGMKQLTEIPSLFYWHRRIHMCARVSVHGAHLQIRMLLGVRTFLALPTTDVFFSTPTQFFRRPMSNASWGC